MDRRSFLLWAGASGAGALATAAGFWRWQEITPTVHYPGRSEGHYLRDHLRAQLRNHHRGNNPLPAPSAEFETDVVILGSGVAGLTAAWKMNKEGHKDFLMIDGPQPYGNAAGGRFGDLAYPTGAHYLPLPSTESVHVREILSDLGVILRNPFAEHPDYDERYTLHAPEDRLLFNGIWQEGLVPSEGVSTEELQEHKRFFAEVDRLSHLRGSDGKRIFVLPSVLSSTDPQWQALDRITLKEWLEQSGYRSPTLHWYLNYCCRDDYGTRYDKVSAWAGLHYFCSRGNKDPSGNNQWLTWPGGLHPIAEAMDRNAGNRRKPGTAISLKTTDKGVEALCFELINGVARTYTVRARKAICAMPLNVAAHVVAPIRQYRFDPAKHVPAYAPWIVANFLMKNFPAELPHAPLSWDNIVYQEPGLGYVVSTHQDIRVRPPKKFVFSTYLALSDRSPEAARKWMDKASPEELLDIVSTDLKSAYGWKLMPCVERVDITLRGHAMAAPLPGFLNNAGLRALRELDGPILFAHADLSGFSVFEEASWWGYRAAKLAVV